MGKSLYAGSSSYQRTTPNNFAGRMDLLHLAGTLVRAFLILSFGIVKRATYVQETYGKQLKSLNGYAQLIALAKKEQWEAPALQQLMNRLDMDGKSPVDALQQLSNELDRLDLRNNQFLYVLLEGSLFFQLQEIVRIERWKARYGQHITGWLEAIGELDALCSLGTFAYNHPAYTYPELAEKSFCFLATRMGHPLMPPAQCVKTTPLSRRALLPHHHRCQHGWKEHLLTYYRSKLPAGLYRRSCVLRQAGTLPSSTDYQPPHVRLAVRQRVVFLPN